MDINSNKEVFKISETQWGDIHRGNLTEGERYLFEKYFYGGNVIEAGCGGGRLSLYINDHFDCSIDAFDFTEDFIRKARKESSNVNFFVADASDLSMFDDEKYDVAIYLQRLISFIPPKAIDKTIHEAYRIIKDGGVLFCSVLLYDGRKGNKLLSLIMCILRSIRNERELGFRDLPWLRRAGRPNFKFLSKKQATVHWFTRKELRKRMEAQGFNILEEYVNSKTPSILFMVCKK